MMKFIEKNRRTLFFIVILCSYVCALAFNCLTPYLSDDYAYLMELRDKNACNLLDLMNLAYAEYFEHGGRLVHYFTFRLFLFIPNKLIFNMISSLYFLALGLLIYVNVEKKKKYDWVILLLAFGMLWFFAVSPGQTLFWLTGAVVYLFATVYILGSITYYRYLISQDSLKRPWFSAVLMLFVSLLAGNSSENNSGAAILILLIVTISKFLSGKRSCSDAKVSLKSFIKPYMIMAFLGYIAGYLILVLSPGAWKRSASVSENDYSGFVGILSHIYKIMVALKELFLPLLIIITLLLVILVFFKRFKSFEEVINNTGILYIIGALAGSFALALIAPPVYRAYFGAGIFLIISVITLLQEVCYLVELKTFSMIMKYFAAALVCLLFTFNYLENLVNLARIYRETNEQTSIMEQAVADGNFEYVEVPMLHEDFDNKYTIAYFPQIDPAPEFWINTFYEGWYGIEKISAIPRDIWDKEH